jgi:hypothetical protein
LHDGRPYYRRLRFALLSAASFLACVLQANAAVPLPKPRPDGAPPRLEQETPNGGASTPSEPPAADSVAKPELSACRLALTEDIAIAPSIPPIHGPGACGGDDLVRLEAVVLSPTQHVALKPAAILRCTMATAIANWVREDAAPLAQGLGSQLSELDNFDSYECRGRNRVKGAQLSEHGKANALDVRSLNLANGTKLSLTDRALSRDIRERVLTSVCTRFTTVLGPGSDWYHEDHIHLDLAERRNNYKLCHWGVYDPLPQTAPLIPAERPADAPPRPGQGDAANPDKAPAAEEQPADGVAPPDVAPSQPAKPTKPSKKKHQATAN